MAARAANAPHAMANIAPTSRTGRMNLDTLNLFILPPLVFVFDQMNL
jgi:hypothetical protein